MSSIHVMPRFVRFSRCTIALLSAKPVLLLATILINANVARAIDFVVGPKEVIYTKSQRSSLNLKYWPDGNLGVIANGNGTYDFYAANGPKPVMTTGTLTNPGTWKQSVTISNLPSKTFDYVSGGPVYQDPTSGARLMIYHAEKHGHSSRDFYSVLGLAVSTDAAGLAFRDLGTIVEPNLATGRTEVGGGSFAIVDDHLHVYYRDWFPNYTTSEVAVARAPISQLISNALIGQGTAFAKYFNGGWSEPGIGGKSSALEIGNPSNSWLSVSYNDYLDQFMMVNTQWEAGGGDLYLSTSSDGINWSPRQTLARAPGEQFYPTMIGTGSDPTHTGESFYVYYTDSLKGAWSRWKDAELVRRMVRIDSPGVTGEPGESQEPKLDWIPIGGFQSDFQSGAPADGWTYAWNPKGKIGKSSGYVALQWSASELAYNTTGAATQLPGTKSKSHHDDYLFLSADGGHPGNKKYLPMAGYTIQDDDGAGYYRIADSSIYMTNSSLIPKEDGLGVLVYVNDRVIGPSQAVSANGWLANFDRELGQLSVGDTIWVMIDPLKNQYDDSFRGFDFAIQKWDFAMPQLTMMSQFQTTAAVPEPSGIAICFIALAIFPFRCRV
ncbi:MAG: hypothetical protein L0228_18180 [Planctomycetes bacterium]|nr:hypothetical protein [Planctomycetota bacterium]